MVVMNKYKTFQKTDLGIGMGGGSQVNEPPSAISDNVDTQPELNEPSYPSKKLTKTDFMQMMNPEKGDI